MYATQIVGSVSSALAPADYGSWYWWDNWSVLVDVLTLLSLGAAIYQLFQARKTNESLVDISGSMSTKFVGKFPDHISEVARLLGTAKRKVVIVCDLLGYGYYSNPAHYMQYKSSITGLPADISVAITIYDEGQAMAAAKEQLGESLEEIQKSETYRNYVAFYKIAKKDRPTSIEQFYDQWAEDCRQHYKEFNVGAIRICKTRVDKSIPVFFWMVDDRAAVFSFPSLSIDPPEVAFETSDPNLLQMFDRIRQDVES